MWVRTQKTLISLAKIRCNSGCFCKIITDNIPIYSYTSLQRALYDSNDIPTSKIYKLPKLIRVMFWILKKTYKWARKLLHLRSALSPTKVTILAISPKNKSLLLNTPSDNSTTYWIIYWSCHSFLSNDGDQCNDNSQQTLCKGKTALISLTTISKIH